MMVMSQFNQGPNGGRNYPNQGNYQQPFNPPPNQSGGGNTVLTVLAIVGGVLLLALMCCGTIAYVATSAIKEATTKFGTELGNVLASSMADDVVSKYQDNDMVLDKVGVIDDYEIEGEKGFSLLTKSEMRIKIKGDKGEGYLVVKRKRAGNQPSEVILEVNGEVVTIDDNPAPIFSDTSEQYKNEPEYRSEFDEDLSDSISEDEKDAADPNLETPKTESPKVDDAQSP